MGSRAFALFRRKTDISLRHSQIRRGHLRFQCDVPCLASRPSSKDCSGTCFSLLPLSREVESHNTGRGMSAMNPQRGQEQATRTNETHLWSAIYIEACYQVFDDRDVSLRFSNVREVVAFVWNRDRGTNSISGVPAAPENVVISSSRWEGGSVANRSRVPVSIQRLVNQWKLITDLQSSNVGAFNRVQSVSPMPWRGD